MTDSNRDQARARLSVPGGWTIQDVLGDDAAGKRFLVRCGGRVLQMVEPLEEQQGSIPFRERFKAKVARAKKVEHECIVPTLGFVEDAGKLFLAEPDVEGVSLVELAETEGALEVGAVLEAGLHVARALGELHRHRLVHGWVRPEAILVTDDKALLRGCGLEYPKGETTEQPAFMSPEQLSEDRSLRPESDFFSLGSTLFAAIVGRPPFAGATPEDVAEAIRSGRPTFPAPEEPQLPGSLALLFAKLLAADPEQRPRSADELVGDIEAVRAGRNIERVTARPPLRKPRRRPEKPRRKLALFAAAAALLCLIAASFLLLPRGPDESPKVARTPGPTTAPASTSAPAAATSEPAKATAAAEESRRAERAAELYEKATKFAAAHPRRFAEIAARFKAVAERYAGTEAALKATRKANDAALKKVAAHDAEFADLRVEVDKLLKERRFGAALKAVNRYETLRAQPDGTSAPGPREAAKRQIDFIRAEAASTYERQSKEASGAIKDERYEDAIKTYEEVAERCGIDKYVRSARRELGIIRPLLAARRKADKARQLEERRKAYEETAAGVRKLVRVFDLEGAVTQSAKLVGELKGSSFEPDAVRHLGRLRRLLALKGRLIKKINTATPKLKSEVLGIRAAASTIESADAQGITLKSQDGVEKRSWAELSSWEKYAITRAVSHMDSPDDLVALGLLSLEQGNLVRAEQALRRAERFGAKVPKLLERIKKAGAAAPRREDELPERMLVEARALVGEKKWLDALALLIPLREKHAKSSYAVRQKLGEVNAMLAKCSRELERSDIVRDIAAGIETPLLKSGIGGWHKRGKGWSLKDGRVTCDNQAQHDVELLKPGRPTRAYRLWVRCRVVSGNGLLIRVASDGDNQYDLWLGLRDKGRTGLWYSRAGKVSRKVLLPVQVRPGQWVQVRAIVTDRHVRAESDGKSCWLPNKLDPGAEAKRFYGFIARQGSKAEFEDFRIRILREQ